MCQSELTEFCAELTEFAVKLSEAQRVPFSETVLSKHYSIRFLGPFWPDLRYSLCAFFLPPLRIVSVSAVVRLQGNFNPKWLRPDEGGSPEAVREEVQRMFDALSPTLLQEACVQPAAGASGKGSRAALLQNEVDTIFF